MSNTDADRDKIVNKLVTDVALLNQGMVYLREKADTSEKAQQEIKNKLDNLGMVSQSQYAIDQQAMWSAIKSVRKDIADIQEYQRKNDPGVKFINKIVSNILTTVALAGTTALLGYTVYNMWGGPK